jgi:hypothetical protein
MPQFIQAFVKTVSAVSGRSNQPSLASHNHLRRVEDLDAAE